MRTVRDMKNAILGRAGLVQGFQLREIDDSLGEFWDKLNRLGARNIKKVPPEQCADIDATVQISDDEWDSLSDEFNRLYAPVRFRRPHMRL